MKSTVYLIVLSLLLYACTPASTTVKPPKTVTGSEPTAKISLADIATLPLPARNIRVLALGKDSIVKNNLSTAIAALALTELSQNQNDTDAQIIELCAELLQLDVSFETIKPSCPAFEPLDGVNNRYNTALNRLEALTIEPIAAPNTAQLWLDIIDSGHSLESDRQKAWSILKTLHKDQLDRLLLDQEPSSNGSGWIALANAYQQNTAGIATARTAIARWQQQWPQHSATINPPDDILFLQTSSDQGNYKAIVALPLSGRLAKVGESIQAGIIAAHATSALFSELQFIDRNQFDSTEELLFAVNQYEADILIGPITKAAVSELANSPLRTLPQVALNAFEVDANTRYEQQVLQLSLMIEDEASFIASLMTETAQHALVLRSNNPLAERAANTFVEFWPNDEDLKLETFELSEASAFSNDVKNALLLSESHTRLREIEDVFIERMENNLRRRQDIDHIFLASTSAQAKAIKPLLAYHFAGDLPVYAPSLIFDGNIESEKNRDIEGIIFADTPWSVDPSDPLKLQLQQHIARGGAASKNLHALAIDAYYLAALQLTLSPQDSWIYRGRTGSLLVDTDGTTQRRPIAAMVSGNYAQQLLIE